MNDDDKSYPPAQSAVPILAVRGRTREERTDRLVVEEPLEIRVLVPGLDGGMARHSVAVTMRTPGHDAELALGFLFTEGVLQDPEQVASTGHCPGARGAARGNVVNVTLRSGVGFNVARLSRNVYTTSSCGICGKASLELIRTACPRRPEGSTPWDPAQLSALGDRVSEAQAVFATTGGLHAAALFDARGQLLVVREDVGRHNAVDKVVGARFRDAGLPASESLLWVSGRASFELVQKTAVAGIPILAAVGAPSSLGVEAAREFDMTLVGFLRDGRFNVYAGAERIAAQ